MFVNGRILKRILIRFPFRLARWKLNRLMWLSFIRKILFSFASQGVNWIMKIANEMMNALFDTVVVSFLLASFLSPLLSFFTSLASVCSTFCSCLPFGSIKRNEKWEFSNFTERQTTFGSCLFGLSVKFCWFVHCKYSNIYF